MVNLTSCQLQCFCVCLHHLFYFFVPLRRLPVQTVSHEPLLGPEAVLESGEAWREHRHRAPQQAACELVVWRHVNVHAVVAHPLTSFACCRCLTDQRETAPTAENPSCWGCACFTFLPSTLSLLSSCFCAAPFKAA